MILQKFDWLIDWSRMCRWKIKNNAQMYKVYMIVCLHLCYATLSRKWCKEKRSENEKKFPDSFACASRLQLTNMKKTHFSIFSARHFFPVRFIFFGCFVLGVGKLVAGHNLTWIIELSLYETRLLIHIHLRAHHSFIDSDRLILCLFDKCPQAKKTSKYIFYHSTCLRTAIGILSTLHNICRSILTWIYIISKIK